MRFRFTPRSMTFELLQGRINSEFHEILQIWGPTMAKTNEDRPVPVLSATEL